MYVPLQKKKHNKTNKNNNRKPNVTSIEMLHLLIEIRSFLDLFESKLGVTSSTELNYLSYEKLFYKDEK